MPGYSSKRNNDGKRWNSGGRFGGQKPKRDDRRSHDQRRPLVSPWESGVTPGMGSGSLLGSYGQNPNPNQNQAASTNAFLLGAAMARGDYGQTSNYNTYGAASKIRRLDRMGGFDDHRGRGLLPSPHSAPLLGVAPSSFPPQSRGPENLQHRLGAPWGSSVQSAAPKGLSSGYYPSKGRQDTNSRRYSKPKRSRPSNSSRSGIRDARDKLKASANKSSSSKAREQGSKEFKPSKEPEADTSLKSESDNKEPEPEVKKEVSEEPMEAEDVAAGEKSVKKESSKSDEKTDEIKVEKKKDDPFPAEALYCHICDLDNFATKKGYIRHLEGMTHSNMAETFHAKNAATLEVLNISAKFAQMRRRDKLIRKSGKKGLPLGKIIESSLVEKFLHPGSCCGEPFDSPYELEEHKLTIQHLLNVYEQKKEKESKEKIVEGDVDEETLDAKITEAKKRAKDEPLAFDNIPPYDSSTPFGMEFIERRPVYHCGVCRGESFKSIDMHCLSFKHYDNIISHLNKQEERRLEEKIEIEKKEQAAKKEAEKKKQEEEEEEEEEEEKMQSEKEERPSKRENADDIEDELDINYSDDEMKSSSPGKSIGKYLKEDDIDEEVDPEEEDIEEEVDPEEDPGEMIVLDEKEFENEDDAQDEEADSLLNALNESSEEPTTPSVQDEEKRTTRQSGRGRVTRSNKTPIDNFIL